MTSKAPGALCATCPLYEQPFVPSEIRQGGVLCVGEAPGAEEVKAQAPFVGISGKLLIGALLNAGKTREDASFTNVVACRPPDNREPTEDEIECCRGRLLHDFEDAVPSRVLIMGKTARETIVPYASYRGWTKLHDGIDAMVTWHPAYVYRKPSEANVFLHDVQRVFEGPKTLKIHTAPEVMMPETYEDLAATLSTAPEGVWTSYDLETNQTVWYDRPGKHGNSILMMGISWDPTMGVIIGDELLYDDPRTVDLLNEFLPRMKTTGHNVKFDNVFLRAQLGVKNRADFDTLIGHYVTDENSLHGLKALAYEELDLPDYEQDLVQKYLKNKNDEYSKVPSDQMAQYCAWDCAASLELRPIIEGRLIRDGQLEWPFNRILMPAQEAFTTMQIRGMRVDIPYLQECRELFLTEIERIRQSAGMLVDRLDINLNSPKQVAEVLWDQLGLPQIKSRKIKARSTAHDAVMHLKGRHPFVDELMQFRRIAKLESSYIENMLEFADVNDRIHADVLLYGTEIGRLSMRDPAVQTIPRPDDEDSVLLTTYDPFLDGAVIRGAIIASLDCLLGVADYSQAELRMWGAESGEPFLIEAYRAGRDIHTEVALGMFGPNWTREQRVKCKMFNFSYVYGGSEYSFAEDAGLPISVARQFVRDYNKLLPVANQWKKDQFELMRAQGYVQSRFGRRRRFPLITPENQDDARKSAVHAIVAGTASDLTTMSATKLILDYDIPVVCLVHDSIETDSPADVAEDQLELAAQTMLEMANTYVPEVAWKVDKEIGHRWAKPPKLSRIVAASTSQERST